MRKTILVIGLMLAVVSAQMMMERSSEIKDQDPVRNRKILQDILNGIYESNGLKHPTTIQKCWTDNDVTHLLCGINELVDDGASGDWKDWIRIPVVLARLHHKMSEDSCECLRDNDEVLTLLREYGIHEHASLWTANLKMAKYIATHLRRTHRDFKCLDKIWEKERFFDFGIRVAGIFHDVYTTDSMELTKAEMIESDSEVMEVEDIDTCEDLVELDPKKIRWILQEMANGVWEKNGLPDPSREVQECFTDEQAAYYLCFMKRVIVNGSSDSLRDILSVPFIVREFLNQVPEDVRICLAERPEVRSLLNLYGLTGEVSYERAKFTMNLYAHRHIKQVHRESKILYNLAKHREAKKFGKRVAIVFHDIFGQKRNEDNFQMNFLGRPDSQEILTLALNGIFEANDLEKPTTLPKCFCERSADLTVTFIGEILKIAAEGTLEDVATIVQKIRQFGEELPEEVVECVDRNEEWNDLLVQYGINDETDYEQLSQRIVRYVTFHFIKIRMQLRRINSSWEQGNFKDAGYSTAVVIHEVVDEDRETEMMNFQVMEVNEERTKKDILYAFFSGIYRENLLEKPRDIMDCFSENVAGDVVDYIDKFLEAVEFDSAKEVIAFLRTLIDGRGVIPLESYECLSTKKEWADLKLKYGINEHTSLMRYYAHVMKYTVTHLRDIREGFEPVKSAWDEDQYCKAGANFGCLLHTITGTPVPEE